MVIAAYMTRGLQLVTRSSKRAQTERAEELGAEDVDIPLTQAPANRGSSSQTPIPSAATSTTDLGPPGLPSPPRSQDPFIIRNQGMIRDVGSASGDAAPPAAVAQTPLPPPRARLWAAYISTRLDSVIYGTVFFFVGIPVYYATGYAMPLHLTFTILAYLSAMSIPLRWRQYLHPVLVSSLATVLGIWVLGLIRGQGLDAVLTEYRVGLKYLQLWEGAQRHGQLPGAGDVLGSVLDASIVSLALPMYQYRRELREHFPAVIIPNILISIGSLFVYPYVCYRIGISAERSLAFAARSLTLALAIPAVENLGGDSQTVGAVAIMSGIVGALIGSRILTWLRIPEGMATSQQLTRGLVPRIRTATDTVRTLDDYVTRGVSLGANSSAVATAALLRTDPRAAALSSLSMSLFGTITVLFTAIPPIASVVKSFVQS